MSPSLPPSKGLASHEKKQKLYLERDEDKRRLFAEEVAKIAKEDLVYLDESGMDSRLHQEYGRSLRGEKLFVEVAGSKRRRTSIIGAICQGNILAPFMFEGSCNTMVFNDWVEEMLVKELVAGQVVILDNASFHKSARTVELTLSGGVPGLVLPPYSPDYNPIEHFWHQLKSHVKKVLPICKNIPSAIEAFFNPPPILT